MEILWFGTATVAFITSENTLIFDPFISRNESLPRPIPAELAAYGDIYITHGHFDHLIDVPKILAVGTQKVFCSRESAESLLRDGVNESRISTVRPGDFINSGSIKLKVYRGEHIKFDLPLIIKTLFCRKTIANRGAFAKLAREARRYPKGEVLIFEIEAEGKRVLHLGSLNLADHIVYPIGVDLLTIPFQGRSDLDTYALKLIERIKPSAILLHHTCDSFPPVSSPVRTENFIRVMERNFPGIKVIRPHYNRPVLI